MYTVDKFMEQVAAAANTPVSQEAIDEIIQISEESKSEQATAQLSEFLESHPSEDGAIGLRYFVVNYLGSQNYEINHSYARLNSLAKQGLVQIFQQERSGGTTIAKVRVTGAG